MDIGPGTPRKFTLDPIKLLTTLSAEYAVYVTLSTPCHCEPCVKWTYLSQ